MKKIIKFFCILLVLQKSVYAFDIFNSKLQIYECNSESSARACSKCKSVDGIKVDFKINADKSTIIQQGYENDNFISSNSFDKCKIIDKKNWECGNGRTTDSVGTTNERQGMNNGVYYYIYESSIISYGKNNSLNFNSIYKSYSCGK